VPPTDETVAVLTVALEDAGEGEEEPVVELEELLPHAASIRDAASAGRRKLIEESTIGLLTDIGLGSAEPAAAEDRVRATFLPGRNRHLAQSPVVAHVLRSPASDSSGVSTSVSSATSTG
jgi:hypothetical protein